MILAALISLTFTAPADTTDGGLRPVASYRMERSADGGESWSSWPMYRDSLGAFSATPLPPGSLEVVWTDLPDSWQSGGSLFRVFSVDAAGNVSEPGNRVLVTAGPDTFWVLRRWKGDTPLPPETPEVFQGSFVSLAMAPQDTTRTAFRHFEQIQLEARSALCRAYGYFCLRGERIDCPNLIQAVWRFFSR